MLERTEFLPEGGKARRVYLLLRGEIESGALGPGDFLPGEQRLAALYGVSRVTVRRALAALDAEGLVERSAGRGTLVRGVPAPRSLAADFTTLMPQIAEMGQKTEARLIAFSYQAPPAAVAAALALVPGARVQRAVRVRLLDGTPFSHLTTHVPEGIAQAYSEADLASTPLFRLLERGGVRIESARQSVSAALATPDVAEALGVSVGAALIALERVVCDADGQGVEHLAALYRPDLFRLEMTLTRVGGEKDRHWEPVIGREAAGGGP